MWLEEKPQEYVLFEVNFLLKYNTQRSSQNELCSIVQIIVTKCMYSYNQYLLEQEMEHD